MRPTHVIRRAALAGAIALVLSGAGAATVTPAAAPAAPAAATDVSGYQQLLNDLLTVISAKGEPLDTRFDYEKFYDMRGRFERCVRIKRQMLAVPPEAMDERTRIAWAINLYNYLVLETATEYLLIPGRGRQRYLGPRDIKTPKGPFFKSAVVEIEGREYTLDQFERHFLFADSDPVRGEAPAGLDPRIHFAVVCGALGCPPLLPRAYKADSLEIQLAFAARNALALPRHLAFSEETGRLAASEIFQWYPADFGGREKALGFIKKYAPAKIRTAIAQRKVAAITGVIPWDWNLNQTVHKKEIQGARSSPALDGPHTAQSMFTRPAGPEGSVEPAPRLHPTSPAGSRALTKGIGILR